MDIPASLRTVLLPFTFRSPSELFFGLVLLYHFRVLERQLGSVNFSIFLAVSFVNSEFLTAAIAYVKSIKRTSLTFGPYTAIFALLTFYYFEVRRHEHLPPPDHSTNVFLSTPPIPTFLPPSLSFLFYDIVVYLSFSALKTECGPLKHQTHPPQNPKKYTDSSNVPSALRSLRLRPPHH